MKNTVIALIITAATAAISAGGYGIYKNHSEKQMNDDIDLLVSRQLLTSVVSFNSAQNNLQAGLTCSVKVFFEAKSDGNYYLTRFDIKRGDKKFCQQVKSQLWDAQSIGFQHIEKIVFDVTFKNNTPSESHFSQE